MADTRLRMQQRLAARRKIVAQADHANPVGVGLTTFKRHLQLGLDLTTLDIPATNVVLPQKRLADKAAFTLGQNGRACLVRVHKCLAVVKKPATAALYHIGDDTGRQLVVWVLESFAVPNAQFEKLKAHGDAGSTSISPTDGSNINPELSFLQLLTPDPSLPVPAL